MWIGRWLACGLVVLTACGDGDPGADPGSLCACAELDGVEVCCFGHGECEAQPEGPDRCACDEGAKGKTCSTPAPGVQVVPMRPCSGDDPGCVRAFDHVVVESFDACADLDGAAFASTLVRPATGGDGAWPAGTFPTAILVHGAGQDHADYYDLLEHLAANGMIVAAIDATAGIDITARANRLLSYLECWPFAWSDGDKLDGRFGLVGHSRGGAAVAVAARAIADGLAAQDAQVEAIVALAPTETGLFAIPPAAAPAYLALQGSRDPDTQAAALAWFDLAGDDTPDLVSGLTWIYGATHQRFHQGLLAAGVGEAEATLTGPEHWTLARATIGGFLMWRLRDVTGYRTHFTGESVPASIAAIWEGSPDVFASLNDATVSHLLVHDFEADTLEPSALGAAVTATDLDDATADSADLLDPPWSGGHQTRALRVAWSDSAQNPSIRFAIPPESADLSELTTVSVRLARPFGSSPEVCEPADPTRGDLRVTITDGTNEHAVLVSELGDAGRIPVPDHLAPETIGNWMSGECHAVDFMRVIRIPLARFCQAGVDLAAVTAIELRFDAQPSGALLIDDLELTRGEGENPAC